MMKNPISTRILNVFPLFLVMYEISNYLANDAYLPAMPEMADQLNTTNHLVQLTLTAFFLGNATMQLILGPISDRYGRRVVLLGGGLVFITTTLICAFSTNIYGLLIARYFQGSAVTSMIVAGYATVHAMYDHVRAIKTLAWMNSITILAPAVGPIFGAMILLMGDWRWIFMLLAIWASVALLILYRVMPETCETTSQISLKKMMDQYWRLLTNWQFVKPTLASGLLFAAMIAWIAAGPFLVVDSFHHSALTFGWIQALIFGSFMLGTRVVSKMIHTVSIEKITKISIGSAFLGGLLSLVCSVVFPNHLIDIVLPMMILALGSGIGFPVFNRMAVEGSEESMGVKVALFSSFMGVSGLLGSIMISSFYDGSVLGFSSVIFGFMTILLLLP